MSGQNKKDKTLHFSFLNGIFASAVTGFTQNYFTPFILVLGGTVRQVGLLNALPNLFGALVQLRSAEFTDWFRSRKKMVGFSLLFQAVSILPMIAWAVLGKVSPSFFIAMVVLFTCAAALFNPPWGSYLSDLIPEDRRGDYFGWRNRILGIITVAVSLAAGLVLTRMKSINVWYGFALLFSAAFVTRVVSWYYLEKMEETPYPDKPRPQFTFFQFLARMKETNFGRFVLFSSLMSFTVNLASPFFAVLMLDDLKFSYALYTVVTITAHLFIFLTMHRWGRHADHVGNARVISFTAPLIGVIPLLWIISRNPLFLIFAQVFSGFVWAGYTLCTSNFIYDTVVPEKRTRCIAYFNVLNGLALFAGATAGGFLLFLLPPLFGHKILALFLISGMLRLGVGLFLPLRLKEVRLVKKVGSEDLFFSMLGTKVLLGVERKTVRY